MKIVKDNINETAQALEEAQAEIREFIQKAYLRAYSKAYIDKKLREIIENATKDIKIERLKKDSERSLINFANSQRQIWQSMRISGAVLVFLGAINGSMTKYPPKALTGEFTRITGVKPQTIAKGVPLQQYYKEVWKDKVKPVLDKLCNDRALDPNDFTGRNSLRNLAEMEVRYQGHRDEITDLKAKGVKVVACSSHADCSGRCAPYQGRLYSLDGTTGEIDGHKYVPLEEATENPRDRYTTKAGRTYQNGLLGFNCFDRLTEVYTLDGWKLFSDLNKTEEFLTLNLETGETEIQKATAWFVYDYNGEMIEFNGENCSLCVTENHDMIVENFNGKMTKKTAENCRLKSVMYLESLDKIEMSKRFKQYNGKVYCVTVPNHTLLVRRNGRAVWCGNCRHYLRPYQGQLLPTVSSAERKKEYAITKKQRAMERAVRGAKIEAIMAKPINREYYLLQRARAQKLYAEYRKFSAENERAFYPMRVDI